MESFCDNKQKYESYAHDLAQDTDNFSNSPLETEESSDTSKVKMDKDKEKLISGIDNIKNKYKLTRISTNQLRENYYNELEDCFNENGYGEIYDKLCIYDENSDITYLSSNKFKNFLNNVIKPPFCYYYNKKTAKNILQNDQTNNMDEFMSYIENNPKRSEKPLSNEEIKKDFDDYKKYGEKEKENINTSIQNLKIIINLFIETRNVLKYNLINKNENLSKKDIQDILFDNFMKNLKNALKDFPDLYAEFEKEINKTMEKFQNIETLESYYLSYFDDNRLKQYILEFNVKKIKFIIGQPNIIKPIQQPVLRDDIDNQQSPTNNKTSTPVPDETDSHPHGGDHIGKDAVDTNLNEDENNVQIVEDIQKMVLSEKDKAEIEEAIDEVELINDDINLGEIRQSILGIFETKGIDIKDPKIKAGMHNSCKTNIEIFGMENKKSYIMMYMLVCGIDDINNESDLIAFIQTVQTDGKSGNKYDKPYRDFLDKIGQYYEDCFTHIITAEFTIQSITARYKAASEVAEARGFYESDIINFFRGEDNGQDQSGLQIASNIDNIDNKLNHYGFNSNKSEHEEAALRYTAFDITFKNTFNLTNPIIEKLGAQQVNLRDDLFSYGIYNQDDNFFNKDARDKYVIEKLQPIGLAPEEIEELLRSMEQLPTEVEKNYEVLSSNFDADQDSFEKIAKIYALGEVIDNIKKLFTRSETLSDSQKLGDFMGLKLDEDKPADVVGDYLLLNGTINGTSTKIKYNLRTGKLYMNTLIQQEFNPPKITIGNDEPNTEIGDIGNFDDILEGYEPTSFTQSDDVDDNQSSSTTDNNPDNLDSNDSDNGNSNESGTETQNQKVLEKLVENKLLDKLKVIGKTVQEKAGEQSKENVVIDNFLKTFNILPDEGNSDTIEFMGGSNLFVILESIKNTNNEDYLLKFSNLMSELMSFCGMTRGKNNLFPNENEFDSVTIFNIDEKNATQDIISLQRANQSFFSDTDGEKDRIKGCKCHFDSSVKLSFANIIVQKCCRRYGEGWKISANHAQEFVDSVKKGIENIKHDENDVVAMENMIEDESMWA